MTNPTVGPDYDPNHETLTDTQGQPLTTDYLEQLGAEADTGYDLSGARQLTPTELTAIRSLL